MRLISSWKDYYDIVQGFGVDLFKVYLRETKEIKNLPFTVSVRGWGAKNNNVSDLPGVSFEKSISIPGLKAWQCPRYKLCQVYVIFAGKLYGGIHLYKQEHGTWSNPGEKTTIKYIWTKEALDFAITEYELEKLKEKDTYWHTKEHHSEYEHALSVLSIRGDERYREWAVSNNISILLFAGGNEATGIENPRLANYEFQRVLDGYTAFQELEQWIGGVLGQNPAPDEIEDKYKIQQHGFDNKWSFRKHKLDNTKERKK